MAEINKNRLQLLYAEYKEDNIVFPTFSQLERHIMQRYELNSKLAEPFVAYYKENEETRMVLCIGAGIVGEANAEGVENGYSIIDIDRLEDDLSKLDEKVNTFDGSIEEIKEAIKTLKEGLANEIEERKKAIEAEKSEREATDKNISDSVGLVKNEDTNKYEFKPDLDDILLYKTKSITEAIDVISKFVQDNNVRYSFKESNIVEFNVNDTDNKNIIVTADIKLSPENGSADGTHDDNILVKKTNGLAAYIDLEYLEKIDLDTQKVVKGLSFTKSSTSLNKKDENTTHTKKFIKLPIPRIEIRHKENSSEYEFVVDDEVIGTIDVLKDRFIDQFEYNEKTKVLRLIYNTTDGVDSLDIPLDDLIDVYKSGDGLSLKDSTFSVKKNPKSEKFLIIDKDGVAVVGVEDEIKSSKESAVKEAKEFTTTSLGNLESDIIGIKEDGTEELTLHGVRNKITQSINEVNDFTNREIEKVKEIVKSGDDKIVGNVTDDSDSLTIHGLSKNITKTKDELTNVINDNLKEAKDYTDSERDRAEKKEAELLGTNLDTIETNSILGVKNRVDTLNEQTKNELGASIEQNKTEVNNKLKSIATQIENDTKKLQEADNTINSRLDIIQGDGDGSIKKAVNDEAEKREVEIKKAVSTEGQLRKDSIDKLKSDILDGVGVRYNSLSKIANEINRETEARINGDKKVALKTTNSKSVNFNLEKSDETGNNLSANVNVSTNNANSLSVLDDGLYVPQINLDYESVTNKLKLISGTVEKDIQLSGVQAIDEIRYDPSDFNLIFKIKKDNGQVGETKVNLRTLIPTPKGISSNPISIKSEVVNEGGELVQNISATLNAKIDDIHGLKEALELRSKEGHNHAISDITDLQVELNKKANVEHRHNANEIDGTFQVTYITENDSITNQPVIFETVDKVISHILDMVKTLIERSFEQEAKIKEFDEKITKAEKLAQEAKDEVGKLETSVNEKIDEIETEIKDINNNLDASGGEGIYVSVKNDDGVNELRRYKIEGSTNEDNTPVVSVINDKENNKFKIDINNLDLGTY